jgi:XRE family transcriptional regulator, regulator of sulfur utilization
MKIGKAIKELRLKKALNQKDYASRIGITQSYLSQIETDTKKPSTELLEFIAHDLDMPLPVMFWFGVEECDITENKREAYKMLKPSIDALITSLF